jgi:hypothetical protein
MRGYALVIAAVAFYLDVHYASADEKIRLAQTSTPNVTKDTRQINCFDLA